METVSEFPRPSDAELADTYWLHGDPWEAPDGTVFYRCACCDLFVEGRHRKVHPRREHLIRLRSTMRVFLNLASRRPLMRGADASENLVQQALDRERTIRSASIQAARSDTVAHRCM